MSLTPTLYDHSLTTIVWYKQLSNVSFLRRPLPTKCKTSNHDGYMRSGLTQS